MRSSICPSKSRRHWTVCARTKVQSCARLCGRDVHRNSFPIIPLTPVHQPFTPSIHGYRRTRHTRAYAARRRDNFQLRKVTPSNFGRCHVSRFYVRARHTRLAQAQGIGIACACTSTAGIVIGAAPAGIGTAGTGVTIAHRRSSSGNEYSRSLQQVPMLAH